ncbi:MAG: SDR family NAD(P)-dependent oxidoreductase [Neisseriaceae bacterium]|nr:SDR family NAD(P)-dependent oxidoreductase [Neisseriaceae bacterium]
MDFKNKVVLITGAGRGLGWAYAQAFAAAGAKVVLNDGGCDGLGAGQEAQVAHTAVASLRAAGGEAVAHTLALGDEAACADLVETAVAAYGGIDVVVHNAGWVGYQPVADSTDAFLAQALSLGVWVPIWLAKHAWPYLQKSANPRMVLTTSDRAMFVDYGQVGLVAYSASKMGQLGVMNGLATDGRDFGLRVNAISPVAKTRMWGMTEAPPDLKPEWVTPGVLYLASATCQDSGYVLRASNGQFTATRFVENPGVQYPYDLARVTAGTAAEVAARWADIKEDA